MTQIISPRAENQTAESGGGGVYSLSSDLSIAAAPLFSLCLKHVSLRPLLLIKPSLL